MQHTVISHSTLSGAMKTEDHECQGDGRLRLRYEHEDRDVHNVRGQDEEDPDVQQVLLSSSGATAPEILRV